VKYLQRLGNGMILGSALGMVSISSAWAGNPVTGVQVNPTQSGLEVFLATQVNTSSGQRPEIEVTSQGNNLVVNITNTQLSLPQGKSFRQDNPMPGITSIAIAQQNDNSIQAIVSGANGTPTGQILPSQGQGITFNFTANSTPSAVGGTSTPVTYNNSAGAPVLTAQVPPSTNTNPSGSIPIAPATTPLVPNPQITIQNNPVPAAGILQPTAPTPPLLPRAVAPPVGDVATSSINTMPRALDLGTAARVPRLVLRDAPVREVLNILSQVSSLNIIYAPSGVAAQGGAPGAQLPEPTISLDVSNIGVQEAFNYVLWMSGLEANRYGNTVFVGRRLPDALRDVMVRTLRLNQVSSTEASSFLTTQGAETQLFDEGLQIQTVGEGAAARVVQTRSPRIISLKAQTQAGSSPLMLSGLSISSDDRLNAITLVGAPEKVEMAIAMLMQLDARKRQVAVNVKIVDVNLLGTEAFRTSFSFGVADSFFSNADGAGSFGSGGLNPPSSGDISNSRTTAPTVPNNLATNTFFLDPNQTITVTNGGTGSRTINTLTGTVTDTPADATFLRPVAATVNDPTQPGILSFTPGTPNTNTISVNSFGQIVNSPAAGTAATATFGLSPIFQYPNRFLSSLKAQITSGNAKILTDPTLVVQEGQTANVQLTQEVFGGTEIAFLSDPTNQNRQIPVERPIIKNAGLTLAINVSRIDDNGFVTMGVNPTVSSPASSSQNGRGEIITLLSSRTLTSGQIRLRDGQTLILSGIIQEADRTTVSKIPILGDLPIIGALFRSTSRENQRQEVIVLVTPQIIDDSSRANFGYNYNPSQEVRDTLQQRGYNPQTGGQ
jgi:type IV pilus assembly protein PilQ